MVSKLGKNAVTYDDSTGFDGKGSFDSDTLVIASPGVAPYAKGMVEAQRRGAKIVGELEFCFPYCNGKCISVTGTNGKTTTCEMIYHVLKNSGAKTRLLGNGGTPFSSQVLDVKRDEIIVLESSSFQLKDCVDFAPYISVFTNLACDHINYHKSFADYASAKEKNFTNMRHGVAIFNKDDENVVKIAEKCACKKMFYSLENKDSNCYYDGTNVVLKNDGNLHKVKAEFLANFARHNLSNSLAAICACYVLGFSLEKAVECLQNYQLLPHRLQRVAIIDGVTFIDDSKATNVHATVSAVKCFTDSLALILGGSDKGESFDAIFDNLQPNVKVVVAVGQTANAIQTCGASHGVEVEVLGDLKQAVTYCYEKFRHSKGVVLMSNACASFDSFGSYAERGDYFQEAVKSLQSGKKQN